MMRVYYCQSCKFLYCFRINHPTIWNTNRFMSGFAKKSDKNKEEKLKYLEDNYTSTAKKACPELDLYD